MHSNTKESLWAVHTGHSKLFNSMEELHRISHRKEQRTVGLLHASKNTSPQLTPSPYAAELPPDLTPPSTPSPRHPFVHLDSTSTASLSHLVPQSHVSPHYAQQPPREESSTGPDTSSLSPCQAARTALEYSIASSSPKRVSLEQHLQCGDAGREEAMQSFILQRFLPAAKTVAADHDCTIHSAGKHHVALMPSTIPPPRSSLVNSTPRAAPVDLKKSTKYPSTLIASKSMEWSHPVSIDDDGENDSVSHEEAAKSCGFFCVGMKSAVSRAHNVVRPSAHTTSASKRRVTLSSSYGTSSDEEGAQPMSMKVMTQDARSQSSASMSASVSLSSSSPATDASTRRVPVRPAVNAFNSRNYLDSRPTLNLCIKCHSNRAEHQLPAQGLPQEYASHGIVSWQSVQTSTRCTEPRLDASVSSYSDNTMQAYQGFSSNDHALCNAGNRDSSSRDPASQTSFKESLVQCNLPEASLGNQYCPKEDELEFYDALSRFDTASSTPATQCKSTLSRSQSASVSLHKCTFGEQNSAQTHLAYVSKGKVLAFDADSGGYAKVCRRQQSEMTGTESSHLPLTSAFKKCGSVFQTRNDVHGQPLSDAYSAISNAYQMSIPDGNKKSSSSHVLGWPLGISSFHSGTSRNPLEGTRSHGDNGAAKTKAQSAKMQHADEKKRHDSKSSVSPQLSCIHEAFSEEGQKHCEKCIMNMSSSLDVLSPMVPPSPTSSWLGRALASKASKPSHLAILQQEEKAVSAKKKLEFTSASDAKKGVRWEDMVKGSQMHPEQFSLSEEIRHHRPTNHLK